MIIRKMEKQKVSLVKSSCFLFIMISCEINYGDPFSYLVTFLSSFGLYVLLTTNAIPIAFLLQGDFIITAYPAINFSFIKSDQTMMIFFL